MVMTSRKKQKLSSCVRQRRIYLEQGRWNFLSEEYFDSSMCAVRRSDNATAPGGLYDQHDYCRAGERSWAPILICLDWRKSSRIMIVWVLVNWLNELDHFKLCVVIVAQFTERYWNCIVRRGSAARLANCNTDHPAVKCGTWCKNNSSTCDAAPWVLTASSVGLET